MYFVNDGMRNELLRDSYVLKTFMGLPKEWSDAKRYADRLIHWPVGRMVEGPHGAIRGAAGAATSADSVFEY